MRNPSSITQFEERETMTFHLPIIRYEKPSGETVGGSIIIGSDGNSSIVSGKEFKFRDLGLKIFEKKLYLNPQSISNTSRKLISKNMTKGGYFFQYWGEDLTTLAISGTTGSAGISEINKLLSIYRHEQIHFQQLSKNKARDFLKNLENNIMLSNDPNSPANNTGNPAMDALSYFDNLLFGGQIGQAIDGVSTFMDTVSSMVNYGEMTPTEYSEVVREQTLATLATSLMMSFKGVYYRGYIDSFSFTETSNEPGIFSYNFNFNIIYQSGIRENFMPWHIESEYNGESRMASTPLEGTESDIYTFRDAQFVVPEVSGSISLSGKNQSDPRVSVSDPDFADFSQNNFRNSFN